MNSIVEFENKIAEFFGAPFAVAVDSCTSGIELCLRLKGARYINCPKRTYLSIPMLANKLNIELKWDDRQWEDYYSVYPDIFDAAVLWRKNSYISGTMMCVSMQYQKHLSIGRLGVILLDKYLDAELLKKQRHDGRNPDMPWRDQDIETVGYHYYATPETALDALDKMAEAINTTPRKWLITDWPDLTLMKVFQ